MMLSFLAASSTRGEVAVRKSSGFEIGPFAVKVQAVSRRLSQKPSPCPRIQKQWPGNLRRTGHAIRQKIWE